jgi:hypothetical protein
MRHWLMKSEPRKVDLHCGANLQAVATACVGHPPANQTSGTGESACAIG